MLYGIWLFIIIDDHVLLQYTSIICTKKNICHGSFGLWISASIAVRMQSELTSLSGRSERLQQACRAAQKAMWITIRMYCYGHLYIVHLPSWIYITSIHGNNMHSNTIWLLHGTYLMTHTHTYSLELRSQQLWSQNQQVVDQSQDHLVELRRARKARLKEAGDWKRSPAEFWDGILMNFGQIRWHCQTSIPLLQKRNVQWKFDCCNLLRWSQNLFQVCKYPRIPHLKDAARRFSS